MAQKLASMLPTLLNAEASEPHLTKLFPCFCSLHPLSPPRALSHSPCSHPLYFCLSLSLLLTMVSLSLTVPTSSSTLVLSISNSIISIFSLPSPFSLSSKFNHQRFTMPKVVSDGKPADYRWKRKSAGTGPKQLKKAVSKCFLRFHV